MMRSSPIQRLRTAILFTLTGLALCAIAPARAASAPKPKASTAATTQAATAKTNDIPAPSLLGKPARVSGLLHVRLKANGPAGCQIRYTLDGSNPRLKSPAYYKSIHVARPLTVSAAWFTTDGQHGPILKVTCREDIKTSTPRIAVNIDPSEAPDLAPMFEKMQETCERVYPELVACLGAPTQGLRSQTTFKAVKGMKGVAYTMGGNVYFAPDYYRSHTDDIGSAVHELVHVIQNYPGGNPGWLVEGLTDYVRFWHYEPVKKRPRFDPARHKYTDSYQVTGSFLAWVVEHKQKNGTRLIPALNDAMRTRAYTPEFFVKATGMDLDALWKEFAARR